MPPLLSFPQSGNVLHKPLDSSFRWNDDEGDSTARWSSMLFRLLSLPLLLVLCPLFHSCPFVIPAKAGIQEGGAGGLNKLRFLPAHRNDAFVAIPAHALPAAGRGNVFYKPLDSGFRRNDDEEIRHGPLTFKAILTSVIPAPFGSLLSLSFHPRRHSSESWNPGRRGRDAKQIAISPCPPAKGRRSSANMSIKPARIYLSLRNPPKLSAIVPAPCRFT